MMRALLVLLLLAADEPVLDLGPMIGHAGPDEVRIWVKASSAAELGIRIGEHRELAGARDVAGPALEAAADFMGHVRVTGLKPLTRYHYVVLLGGKPAMARPYPWFNTAPPAGEKTRFRFAFGSCVGKFGANAAAAWGDMAARTRFDLLLLLGDNHYADSTDPAELRPAYYTHRRVAGYREITQRTPTYGIWDDHDYGPNNSDGTAPGKADSLRVFKEMWANPGYGQEDDPGIYSRFAWGDADFFLLDSRYHRTPNKLPEDGTKTMLGAKQLAWLKRELEGSKASLKFVACGSEFQINTQPDCWSSFARERDDLFKFIEDKGVKGVIFLSGDRHFVAAYQIRGRFLEVTSGPLGSRNAISAHAADMFLYHALGKLYTVFQVDPSSPAPATLEIYRAGEGLVERRSFTWAEINGEKRITPLEQLKR